jgi:hypothetical protein
MTEVLKHFVDAQGGYFVAPFANQQKADAYQPPEGAEETPPRPSADYAWQGGEWVYVEPPEPPAPVPADFVLTDRQLRLGLIAAGVLPSTVRAAIEVGVSDALEREAMLTWFDFTRAIHWDHPVTQQLMAIAGFDAEQAAAMWLAAAEIDA